MRGKMHDEPRNRSFLTPVFRAASITFVSMTRFWYKNSAGRVELAQIPPTFAAATKTASIFRSAIQSFTAA